jgi:hypothetical protein
VVDVGSGLLEEVPEDNEEAEEYSVWSCWDISFLQVIKRGRVNPP